MTLRVGLMISAAGWRGSGVSYAKLASGLQERGHEVGLVTVFPPVTERFMALGLPVTQLPLRRTGVREAWMLGRAMAGLRPDVVMADTPRDLRLLALATLPRRTPVVYRYNCRPGRAPTRLDDRLFFQRAGAIVFLSRAIRGEALSLAPWLARIRAFEIPNGFDTARFAPDHESGRRFRDLHRIPPAAPVVLTPGTLARGKGHETVMQALAAIAQAGGPVATHVVLGGGAREAELRRLAATLPVPTIFTGALTEDDVRAALNAADVVTHPSERETFGNAVAEAMACGRAVVTTTAGAAPELLGAGDAAGVLVPPGDTGRFAEAIARLLRDPALRARLGSSARDRIIRSFGIERMISGYVDMFSRLARR